MTNYHKHYVSPTHHLFPISPSPIFPKLFERELCGGRPHPVNVILRKLFAQKNKMLFGGLIHISLSVFENGPQNKSAQHHGYGVEADLDTPKNDERHFYKKKNGMRCSKFKIQNSFVVSHVRLR